MNNRPSWDEYFMEMAELARKRSTCLRRGVGAVIVKDNRVIATGYNGVPRGISHCLETGRLRAARFFPGGGAQWTNTDTEGRAPDERGTVLRSPQPRLPCSRFRKNR